MLSVWTRNWFRTMLSAPKRLALDAGRRVYRLARWGWWAARKSCYYLLPPAVYSALKGGFLLFAPRVFQKDVRARFITAVQQRISPPAPQPHPPAPDAAPTPPPSGWSDPAAVANYERYRSIFWMPEETEKQVLDKTARYRALATETRTDRVRLLREIARLERMAGNAVKGCLYAVRAMRLMGRDEFDDLAWVRPTLEANGYAPEAETAFAMFSRYADREAACLRVIEAQFERCKPAPELPDDYTIFDDRRGSADPKVAVVITVYNAADKLPTFLDAIQLQTLNRAGRMELIVVDSASPKDEYAAFQQTRLTHPIPSLFVRTAGRETIQTAWNRAIGLARAPYLCLLGADENLLPDALAAMAAHLDAEADLDWVQSNCLVVEVDRHGTINQDVMSFDRAGYSADMVRLDSCYLGPVGAVYRKAMHQKCGYFDGAFRGSGDTEFKMRMLPFAKVKHVPQTFGLFLNYPEERTTASPRAELEDLRAWYLHRTPAGVRWGTRGQPPEALETLLCRTLRYRKSYLRHYSTDFDLADSVLRVLRTELPASSWLKLADGVSKVLAAYRGLDHLPGVLPDEYLKAVADARRAVEEVQATHRGIPDLGPVSYEVYNDNRHEQHYWYW
jgi:glycosyltransferase involved in cell wall biosynthesis